MEQDISDVFAQLAAGGIFKFQLNSAVFSEAKPDRYLAAFIILLLFILTFHCYTILSNHHNRHPATTSE